MDDDRIEVDDVDITANFDDSDEEDGFEGTVESDTPAGPLYVLPMYSLLPPNQQMVLFFFFFFFFFLFFSN